MATTEQADAEQCLALTEDGGRCSRPAQEDGFCYQHDESDPTVDEGDSGGEAADGDAQSVDEDEDTGESNGEMAETDADSEDGGDGSAGQDADPAADDGTTTEQAADANEDDADESAIGDEGDGGILEVRRTVEATAEGLIGHRLDGVSEVSATEDGWRALVEVVERSSVPDTQDILGQYEVQLSDDVEVQGYRRIDRYRRSDTDA